MESRKFACLVAAGFIGVGLVGAATQSAAAPLQDVVVKGRTIDPQTQRVVSYRDLNLAFRPAQKILRSRISRTAWDLCNDLEAGGEIRSCTYDAIHSTDDQVAAAIARAQRKLAGLPAGPAVAISMVIGSR